MIIVSPELCSLNNNTQFESNTTLTDFITIKQNVFVIESSNIKENCS